MQVQLNNPELQKFVEDKVSEGQFPSAEAVVENALNLMKHDEEIGLTPEDIEAIEEADAAMDRGEFVDFDTFAAEMRKKYCGERP